ncbi:MAG: hypothetical protein QM538_03525 [Methylacidiphilales bacterium]|nr:hypothetical protein [Candidatus Methylacidiphilales bacterium]
MSSLCTIRHASVISDQGLLVNQKLIINNGTITQCQPDSSLPVNHNEYNYEGKVIMPAAIDLVSFAITPNMSKKEIGETLSQLWLQGYAHVCIPSTAFAPWQDVYTVSSIHSMDFKQQAILHILPACTKNHLGENLNDLARLQEAGAKGFSFWLDPILNLINYSHTVRYNSSLATPLHFFPQDPMCVSQSIAHDSILCTELGLTPYPSFLETIPLQIASTISSYYKSALHVHLLSAKESIQLLQSYQDISTMSASVSIFHLLFTEEEIKNYDTRFKLLPPLRSLEDRDALRKGFQNNLIQAICSYHQPRKEHEKFLPYGDSAFGSPSSAWMLLALYDLARNGEIEYSTISKGISSGPAKILGIPSTSIEVGNQAHFIVLDPSKETTISPLDPCDILSGVKIAAQMEAINYLGSEFRISSF